MAALKTKKNENSVEAFLLEIADESRRADCEQLLSLMRKATGQEPKMWGPAMVGFGEYHYKYDSGQEGDWFRIGFSPRKQNLTVYLTDGFSGYAELLAKLGKHKTGKSCLYISKMADINIQILEQLMSQSFEASRGN